MLDQLLVVVSYSSQSFLKCSKEKLCRVVANCHNDLILQSMRFQIKVKTNFYKTLLRTTCRKNKLSEAFPITQSFVTMNNITS